LRLLKKRIALNFFNNLSFLSSTLKRNQAMNFFRRRKILKKANYLDLTPLRLMDHRLRDDGKVNVLLPRFKSRLGKALLQPAGKSQEIEIKLDETGSVIWLMIDGMLNVHEICTRLEEQMPEKFTVHGETEKRVTEFLSLLYQQRYITFREILEEK
jgi:hypothetical protein